MSGCEHAGLIEFWHPARHPGSIPLDIPWACREHSVRHPRGKRKKRTAEMIYGIATTIEKTQKTTRKPRFQNQWVAKTFENTKTTKKTKISEPMGNENHREYKTNQKYQDFRTNDREPESLILKSCFCFCILDGCRYPLVLKSWFSCLFVFSMVLATHWFWNLGFLGLFGILDGFGYPLILESWLSWFYAWLLVTHWSFLVNMCMLKVLFRHSETTHRLENVYMA